MGHHLEGHHPPEDGVARAKDNPRLAAPDLAHHLVFSDALRHLHTPIRHASPPRRDTDPSTPDRAHFSPALSCRLAARTAGNLAMLDLGPAAMTTPAQLRWSRLTPPHS